MTIELHANYYIIITISQRLIAETAASERNNNISCEYWHGPESVALGNIE